MILRATAEFWDGVLQDGLSVNICNNHVNINMFWMAIRSWSTERLKSFRNDMIHHCIKPSFLRN